MSESDVLRSLRLELGKRDDLILWRNNVGLAWYRKGGGRPVFCKCGNMIELNETPVRYGLCNGSSDLVGIQIPTGRFVAVEGKYGKGKLTPDQARFLALVERAGGIAVEAREARDVLVRL